MSKFFFICLIGWVAGANVSYEYPPDGTKLCVKVVADLELNITYKGANNTDEHYVLPIPDHNKESVDGQCDDGKGNPHVKELNYGSDIAVTGVGFYFRRASNMVQLRIEIDYNPSKLNSTNIIDSTPDTVFSEWTSVSHINSSYICTGERSFQLYNSSNNYAGVVVSTYMQAQGYNIKDGKFSPADACPVTPPTTTTTHKPTPTTKTTATTTHKPTPTTKTTATTHKPTPTTNTTATTTHKPTPTPTTTPHMVDQNFTVTEKNGIVCLVMDAKLTVKLHYMKNESQPLSVPISNLDKATASGSCSNDSDVLTINWIDNKTEIELTMQFTKSGSNYSMSAVNVSYSIAVDKGKPINGSSTTANLKEFNTKVGDYYDCSNDTSFMLSDGSSLEVKDLKIQAFRGDKYANLTGSVNDCYYHKPSSKTSAVVPIAVGAALAAMVVIVLIGYCIGRRRARTAGYESMS